MLGNNQLFLTLSVAEGFGLVPLEAMAAGCTILGFDGFGGRDYMAPLLNCAVRPYPDIEGVARDLIRAMEEPEWACGLAAAGQRSAADYSRARFRAAWRGVLEDMLEEGTVSAN